MIKKLLLWVIGISLLLFTVLQLIPVNRTNPPVGREVNWDSPQTQELARRACFDCHSNETVWPWYTSVAPVSLLIANHVIEGREKLNFSEWDRRNHDFEEVEEAVREGEMPLLNYLLLHPEAKLTATEKDQLLDGLQVTFQQDPPRRP